MGGGSIPNKGNDMSEDTEEEWAFQVPGTERSLEWLEYSKPG